MAEAGRVLRGRTHHSKPAREPLGPREALGSARPPARAICLGRSGAGACRARKLGDKLWPFQGPRTGWLSPEELFSQHEGFFWRVGRVAPREGRQVSQRRLRGPAGSEAAVLGVSRQAAALRGLGVESWAAGGTRMNLRGRERGGTFSCDSVLTQCHF